MARELTFKCDYAWAAGFFDGEGCTRVNRTTNRYDYSYDCLVMQITQMNQEPLVKFHRIFGGKGRIYNRKDGAFLYQCSRQEDVHFILEKMWPYLCSTKQLQANAAIEAAIGRVA